MPFIVWGTKKTTPRQTGPKFQRSGLGPGWAAGVCAGPADVSGTWRTRQRGAPSPGTRPQARTMAKTLRSTPAASRGTLGAYRTATTRQGRQSYPWTRFLAWGSPGGLQCALGVLGAAVGVDSRRSAARGALGRAVGCGRGLGGPVWTRSGPDLDLVSRSGGRAGCVTRVGGRKPKNRYLRDVAEKPTPRSKGGSRAQNCYGTPRPQRGRPGAATPPGRVSAHAGQGAPQP